jgi:hypothetical protein
MPEGVKVLSRLEAAVLGVYLAGAQWMIWFRAHPSVSKEYVFCKDTKKNLGEGYRACGVMVDVYNDISIQRGFLTLCNGENGRLELRPWLTAHGIVPPEVRE